jgi:hypothetical protein
MWHKSFLTFDLMISSIVAVTNVDELTQPTRLTEPTTKVA